MGDVTLLRTFNFRVQLAASAGTGASGSMGDGGFQDVSGLEAEMDVKELLEGGRNDGVVQRAGRAKYGSKLILKRGMFTSDGDLAVELWQWFQDAVAGVRPLRRYDAAVEVLDHAGADVVATWRASRCLPARIVGPTLNARTGEVGVEELHLAHEGLWLEGTV